MPVVSRIIGENSAGGLSQTREGQETQPYLPDMHRRRICRARKDRFQRWIFLATGTGWLSGP